MRGKVFGLLLRLCHSGITPAYAGKRALRAASAASSRDHPRVCGEKKNGNQVDVQHSGSPPRMRGKEKTPELLTAENGITPAYAGKSVLAKNLMYQS